MEDCTTSDEGASVDSLGHNTVDKKDGHSQTNLSKSGVCIDFYYL